MKTKNTFALLLAAIMLALSFTACSPSKKSEKKSDIYKFENYKSDEVFDIEKVKLDDELSEKCTSYKFSYISDGYKIRAYISLPNSAIKSQKPCKCVIFNRGGNSILGVLQDSDTANACIISDRIIVASQYRGADGSEGVDQFGGDDLNDVIKLIDLCEKNFSFVDMDDLCVAGASRGGMMTYMAARKDKRVKRIISISGVCDLFACYKEREDMNDLLENYIGGTPDEKPSEYEKRSAVCWYDEIKIPVLIIHSKLDKQVSYKQAKTLYKKLKKTTDCTFISHGDDTHAVIHSDDKEPIRKFLNN